MSKKPGAALVTGGAIRLGREIALHLASKGYDIALHYNSSAREALKTKKDAEKLGVNCEIFKNDLSKVSEAEKLVKLAAKKFPKLNLLVNNASIFERVDFLNTDEKIFRAHMDINLATPFFLSQAFAKIVKKGNIINITDTHITKDRGEHFAYLLAKKGLHDLTRMMALALAPSIKVNAIAPGIVIPSGKNDATYYEKKRKSLPMQKTASIKDVTNAFDYILTTGITGECLFVDGGEHIL